MAETLTGDRATETARPSRLKSLLQAIGRRIYYRHSSIWFERPLDDTLEIIKPRFNGRLDFDHPEQVLNWIAARDVPGTNDPAEIASIRKRGHLPAGVFDGPEMIGYVKIGWDKVYILDYRIELALPRGAFFILDAYIMPEKRGLGAGPFIASATSLEMKRRGFSRRLSHVRIDNAPMLKSGRKAGYREIGRVDFFIILGKKFFKPHPSSFLDVTTAG